MKIKNSMAEEPELLELLKRGESRGFQILYKKTFSGVSHYITNNSGKTEDAEDVFQDAMIALLNNIRKENFLLTTSIENYFLSITRNLWLGQLKKKKLRPMENIENLGDQWSNWTEVEIELVQLENERQEKLYKQFETLGEDCRKLLTGFYYLNKSLEELSKTMNYTYDFIKVKKFRCMKELRNKLIN